MSDDTFNEEYNINDRRVEQGMIFNISPVVVSLYKYWQDMEDDWSSQVHHNISIVHHVIHNTIICDGSRAYSGHKTET